MDQQVHHPTSYVSIGPSYEYICITYASICIPSLPWPFICIHMWYICTHMKDMSIPMAQYRLTCLSCRFVGVPRGSWGGGRASCRFLWYPCLTLELQSQFHHHFRAFSAMTVVSLFPIMTREWILASSSVFRHPLQTIITISMRIRGRVCCIATFIDASCLSQKQSTATEHHPDERRSQCFAFLSYSS